MIIAGCAALVTGGASGLGRASAGALAGAGAVVTLVDRQEELGEKVAAELGAQFVSGDVADEAAVQAAVALAGASAPLRIVVNCAGIGWAARMVGADGSPHPLAGYEKVLRVNLLGTLNVMRLTATAIGAAAALEDGERGVIINTASVAAFDGQIGQTAYAASKGGVVALTLPAARDLSAMGVRVNTIVPGTFETPLMDTLPEERRDALGRGVLFPKRIGRPDEFASLVLELVRNSYINAEVVRLDGGIRMPPK